MVMLAMLFIAEQRAAHQPTLALLSPRDIVEMLKRPCRANLTESTRWSPGSTSATLAGKAPSMPEAEHSQSRLSSLIIIPYKMTLSN